MDHAHSSDDHGAGGHVVPVPLLAGILGALMVLTVVTVAVTWVDLGIFNLFIALLIAVVKASLVGMYFMHLRWDRPFNAIVLITSLFLVALFIALTLLDSHQYQPELIPGYSPDMTR